MNCLLYSSFGTGTKLIGQACCGGIFAANGNDALIQHLEEDFANSDCAHSQTLVKSNESTSNSYL
eukprot:4100638-Ditylum_brightwellii.AAC.1